MFFVPVHGEGHSLAGRDRVVVGHHAGVGVLVVALDHPLIFCQFCMFGRERRDNEHEKNDEEEQPTLEKHNLFASIT